MNASISGIHHVTAIAGEPQSNVDFYVGVLGLRVVKLTVNFDDPGTYHLYYGDERGRPGSVMTFFPWPGAPKGERGEGQATATSFSVPLGSLAYWVARLTAAGVEVLGPNQRFEERVLSFHDPDGLVLEIVGDGRGDPRAPWERGSVPPEHAIRGFHGVTLAEKSHAPTASLLVETLGFHLLVQEENRYRYAAGDGAPGGIVDLLDLPRMGRGLVAVGTVHHVAWRTPTDEEQGGFRSTLARRGLQVTPVADRHYFHSIYFREPGGVLFEIATDQPGFTVDEPLEALGQSLRLPPWLEPRRAQLTEALPALRIP